MALMFNLRLILATLLLLGMWASLATSRTLFEVSIAEKHEQWVVQHGRVYKDDIEKAERHKTLRQNLEHIESVNKAGTRTYKLGINEFTDMTNEEFQATHNGYKILSYKKIKTTSSLKYENMSDVPSFMDWRKSGAVTNIKHQGQCGKSQFPIQENV
ncbi:hypothetical protein RND71_012175 [Anisodus tanguticus]|uniref:Cathepsin propeptide inhibitor domain-containing protein n=1 Tax=Anisodus tanguticus TaxID=243964 RepID=A0AAE1SCR6_9SOLA|nr:hypothetical protein RND71_012175 [Anisodus tanguticus]